MYDIAIVGAGINGTSVAYEFIQAGKKVIVFDKDAIAAGGSGAAGAFISPKFSKAGELKELIHDAFVYSTDFYEKNFPNIYNKTRLIHIAKDEKDAEDLKYYKTHTSLKLYDQNSVNIDQEYVSIDSGIVDAKNMCEALCEGAKFKQENISSLVYEDSYWVLNDIYAAKEVVLATGAYKSLLNEPCIKLRGVWGHRIDIKTSTKNENSIHHFVSMSPNNGGVMAIGATHNVHYHPETSKEEYDLSYGRVELLEKATRTLDLTDVEIIKDYVGLRSGSFDYLPLLGRIVNSHETLECGEKNIRVKKPDFEKFIYYPNLYMINGNGGYGFVLAPYLAKKLADYILKGKKIEDMLSPARFFARWVKRG
ncbi:NAD(P)/FAD-dependent oxidoreductase [Sulfurimonas sp.]|uniref:NAD(P)/FAD-dependent oxidoreductase n=1 Tax=Sulfurimonas sp. TaxID=2022749 RepID=UPI0035666FE8